MSRQHALRDLSPEYCRTYFQECWEARQYYKDHQVKLLYWVGTLFVAVVAATRIFGAMNPPDTTITFTLYHVLIFHAVFTVAWLYLKYMQLNADMFEYLGKTIEAVARERCDWGAHAPPPSFFAVKDHYIGPCRWGGRGLSNLAGLILIGIYAGTVTYPIWHIAVVGEQVTLRWDALIALALFGALMLVGQVLYLRARARIIIQIDLDLREKTICSTPRSCGAARWSGRPYFPWRTRQTSRKPGKTVQDQPAPRWATRPTPSPEDSKSQEA